MSCRIARRGNAATGSLSSVCGGRNSTASGSATGECHDVQMKTMQYMEDNTKALGEMKGALHELTTHVALRKAK